MRYLTDVEVRQVSAGSAFGTHNGPFRILDGTSTVESKTWTDNGDGTGTLVISVRRQSGGAGTPGFDDEGMITYQINTNAVGGTLTALGNWVGLAPNGGDIGNILKAVGGTIVVGGWVIGGGLGGANIPQYMPTGPGAAVGGPF